MLKVTVIGSGNVAQHLIKVLMETPQVTLVQAYARNSGALAHLLPPEMIISDFDRLQEADVYIIAVTDDAIAQVSSLLPFTGRLVVHTSGSVAIEQVDGMNRRGVFYPLQTFSKNKHVDLRQVPLCLESEHAEDYKILEQLAALLSDAVYPVDSAQRQSLHVAAVFVSNFVNHMYAIGNSICNEHNIPFDILKPLIQETANKIQELPPLQAQTGPAVRHDKQTIGRHLEFLTDDNRKAIYTLLTQSIQQANGPKL